MIDINNTCDLGCDMVRRIFLVLDDVKYMKLLRLKGDKTWEQFLVNDLLAKDKIEVGSG